MSRIKVIAKLRPFLESELRDDATRVEGNSVSLKDARNETQRVLYNTFSACYDHASTQAELFDEQIKPMLDDVYNGTTLAVLCYGVTNSGKTTTMQGTSRRDYGIIPRVVEALTERKIAKPSGEILLSMQYFEVYCDDCYDLLVSRTGARKLAIREENGQVWLPDLSSVEFATIKDFDAIFRKASKARSTRSTSSNRTSSRSHAILSIFVSTKGDQSTHYLGKVDLVDLAGSERLEGTKTESIAINKSLFALNRVITALNNKESRIPYQDHILTRILKNALGGSSLAVLICNLAPGIKYLNHTRRTIEFATRAKGIKIKPHRNLKAESEKSQMTFSGPEFERAVEEAIANRLAGMKQKQIELQSTAAPLDGQARERGQEGWNESIDVSPLEAPQALDECAEILNVVAEAIITQERMSIETPDSPTVEEEMREPEVEEVPELFNMNTGELETPIGVLVDSNINRPILSTHEAKELCRKRLDAAVAEKKRSYIKSKGSFQTMRVARALIVAAKIALDEHDDIEYALNNFEKAISWYPKNRRLLEETLRLRERVDEMKRSQEAATSSKRRQKVQPGTKSTPKNRAPASLENPKRSNERSRMREDKQEDSSEIEVEKSLLIEEEEVQVQKAKTKRKSKDKTRKRRSLESDEEWTQAVMSLKSKKRSRAK